MATTSSDTTTKRVTRLELFELLSAKQLISKAATAEAKKYMLDYVMTNIPGLIEKEIYKNITLFSANIIRLWKLSGRKRSYFLSKNYDWLQVEIASTFDHRPQITPIRPVKQRKMRVNFVESSLATKKRRTKSLVAKSSPEELAFATQTSFTKQGKRNAAIVIKQATASSPRSLKKMKHPFSKTVLQPYSAEEALALIINAKLTVSQYKQIRKEAIEKNCRLYPSYDTVLKAKKECYPQDITVTETSAEIKLQSLLNHVVLRTARVQEEVLSRYIGVDNVRLEMKYKWGFDGSSGHSMYKIKFTENPNLSDSDMLLTSLVPLQLNAIKSNGIEEIAWKNPRPSSTRFCVPIRIQFTKENQEIIKKEGEYIEDQITSLMPTIINVDGSLLSVHHVLMKTMVDGKIVNTLTDNKSSQTCYICKATPNQMNNIDTVLKRSCNIKTFEYGLSTLHAHIRFFECILHISYKLETKSWRIRADIKDEIALKKQEVIDKFRTETGLLVDVVKQSCGNTNDGNTARRFFKEPKLASEITKVDEELIRQFSVILQAISCGYQLNTEAFREYSLKTAKHFVKMYPWYKMPASVHKILIHGADVIESLLLPIGQLSEEALEARHKECRYYREHNTRKIGRKENMEDLLHALLISSDPIISSIRPLPNRKNKSLNTTDVLQLIAIPENPILSQETDHSSSDSEIQD